MIRLFGTTIRETIAAFEGAHLGSKKAPTTETGDRTKAIGRIIISLVLVFTGAYLVTVGVSSTSGAPAITSGTAILSLVAGYWLK